MKTGTEPNLNRSRLVRFSLAFYLKPKPDRTRWTVSILIPVLAENLAEPDHAMPRYNYLETRNCWRRLRPSQRIQLTSIAYFSIYSLEVWHSLVSNSPPLLSWMVIFTYVFFPRNPHQLVIQYEFSCCNANQSHPSTSSVAHHEAFYALVIEINLDHSTYQ